VLKILLTCTAIASFGMAMHLSTCEHYMGQGTNVAEKIANAHEVAELRKKLQDPDLSDEQVSALFNQIQELMND